MLVWFLKGSLHPKALRPVNSVKIFLGPRANYDLVPKFHVACFTFSPHNVLALKPSPNFPFPIQNKFYYNEPIAT
jgi:hypothetical protein